MRVQSSVHKTPNPETANTGHPAFNQLARAILHSKSLKPGEVGAKNPLRGNQKPTLNPKPLRTIHP